MHPFAKHSLTAEHTYFWSWVTDVIISVFPFVLRHLSIFLDSRNGGTKVSTQRKKCERKIDHRKWAKINEMELEQRRRRENKSKTIEVGSWNDLMTVCVQCLSNGSSFNHKISVSVSIWLGLRIRMYVCVCVSVLGMKRVIRSTWVPRVYDCCCCYCWCDWIDWNVLTATHHRKHETSLFSVQSFEQTIGKKRLPSGQVRIR